MGRIKENDLRRQESHRVQTVLGDLTQDAIDIFCWCNRCGHNAVVATAVLVARLAQPFRCRRSGSGFAAPAVAAKISPHDQTGLLWDRLPVIVELIGTQDIVSSISTRFAAET